MWSEDRKLNEDLGIQSVADEVKCDKLRWFGHHEHMSGCR